MAIWAAATSGATAIPILMLACLLARIWSGPEATSLWVELVAHRCQEIKTNCTDNEAALRAAQQDITRSHLADWDASARAWLRTADEARAMQQTQLMLMINNSKLPVSNNRNTYQSVIDSSTLALLSMEKLVKGQPQRAENGAFLLGLSSWHLYPDMAVYGSVTQKIDQNDNLFPTGTMVTLGLESNLGIDEGIHWSLPLAYLRYYGDPIQSSRSTGHDALRVSMDQLFYVALGSLFSDWVERSHDLKKALKLFDLSESFKRAETYEDTQVIDSPKNRQQLQESGWLNLLTKTAASYLDLRQRDKDFSDKLMALGRRRFRSFLAPPKNRLPPYFGLRQPSVFFPLLKNNEKRINILRQFAEKSKVDRYKVIIRYKHIGSRNETFQQGGRKEQSGREHYSAYAYASVFPCPESPPAGANSAPGYQLLRHKRWIATDWRKDDVLRLSSEWVSTHKYNNTHHERKSGKKLAIRTADDRLRDRPRGLLRLLKLHKYAVCKCTNSCTSKCLCNYFADGCIHECFYSIQGHTCDKQTRSPRMVSLSKKISTILAMDEDCVREHPWTFVDHCRKSNSIRNLEDGFYDEIYDRYENTWESDKVDHVWNLRGAPWNTKDEHGRTEAIHLKLIYGDPTTAALKYP